MPCGIYQFQAKNVCNARVAAMAVTFFETFELRKIVHVYTFIVQKWDEEKKREGVRERELFQSRTEWNEARGKNTVGYQFYLWKFIITIVALLHVKWPFLHNWVFIFYFSFFASHNQYRVDWWWVFFILVFIGKSHTKFIILVFACVCHVTKTRKKRKTKSNNLSLSLSLRIPHIVFSESHFPCNIICVLH